MTKLERVLKTLTTELKNDPELRICWRDNISMSFQDAYNNATYEYPADSPSSERLREIANGAAENFLNILCK